jgi:hypothetical protein
VYSLTIPSFTFLYQTNSNDEASVAIWTSILVSSQYMMAIDLHWIFGIRYYWASLEIPENFVRIIDSKELQSRMTVRNTLRNFKICNISGLIFNSILGIILGVSFYKKIMYPLNTAWISCFFVV